MNQVILSGKILSRQATRYTPAGVAVVEACLEHSSQQEEAEIVRDVSLECRLIALGEQATWLAAAPLNCLVEISGFLAARAKNAKATALHVRQIKFIEVN